MQYNIRWVAGATATLLLCSVLSGCSESENTIDMTATTATITTTSTQGTSVFDDVVMITTTQGSADDTTVTTVFSATTGTSTQATTRTTPASKTSSTTLMRTTASTTVRTSKSTTSATRRTTTSKATTTKTTVRTTTTTAPAVSQSEFEAEVLRLTNLERTAQGLSPLSAGSAAAQSAADVRAAEIGTRFSHTRPNGSSCFTALTDAGISYRAAGENIAKGHRTPAQVVEGWMNSDGHRRNILSEDFTHLAVGYIDYGWVQLFYTP